MKIRVLLAALFFSVTALADPSPDAADEARLAMRRGNDALERRDATTALQEYETAKRLVPEANAPYYFAASALEMLGRWREAVANLESYLAKDPAVSDAPQVKERIGRIRAQHYPARLSVRLNPESATLYVDGAPLDGQHGKTIELPPGKHRLEGRAPGRLPATQQVDLAGDADGSVILALPIAPAPAPASPMSAASPALRESNTTPWRTIGWSVAGAGAATLGAALVLDLTLLDSKLDEYDRATDPTRGAALRSDARELQGAVLITYLAGAVLVAGGVAIALLAPRSSVTTSARRALISF